MQRETFTEGHWAIELKKPRRARELGALATLIGLSEATGALGALWTNQNLSPWYRSLKKPAGTPPNWVFAPVWTVLFTLAGISAWLVWKERPHTKNTTRALRWWGAQLGLNAAWSGLFFGKRSPGLALGEIGLLWGSLLGYTATAYKVNRLAAWLMLPYIGWVTYAMRLNEAIWRNNRPPKS